MKTKPDFVLRLLAAGVVLSAITACSVLPLGTSGSKEAASGTQKAATSPGGGYNYGEALQKAIMFYEFQRSGKINPADTNGRMNWRGDSDLKDGSDNGVDLTGGWHDAGDHVKFNLPMAYSVSLLSWAVYEYGDAVKTSGQYVYLTNSIKWATDYLLKCSAGSSYYYQVGSGASDHAWWGSCEVNPLVRPSYALTSGGSAVVGETAAALAAAAWVFQNSGDTAYASTLLTRAQTLYASAASWTNDSVYNAGAAGGYYSSSSWADDLSWAAVWIYIAGGGSSYLTAAQTWTNRWPVVTGTSTWDYRWTHCWDDVHYGAELLLAKLTGQEVYRTAIEQSLQFWTTGYNGLKVTYTPNGLAWLSQWGCLRYAMSEAFLAFVYTDWANSAASNQTLYRNFAESQVNYVLGATGRSFEMGFGVNPPKRPHHRTAQGSWAGDMNIPNYSRHVLYGALTGGPDSSDGFTDDPAAYQCTEPACDYNAGFVASLSRMYKIYGGTPIANFTNAIEVPSNTEFFVSSMSYYMGTGSYQVVAFMNNMSGWPARPGTNLSFKWFINTSSLAAAGYSDTNVTIQATSTAWIKISPNLIAWNAANHIYYVNVDFSGTNVYPGGNNVYQLQASFQLNGPSGAAVYNYSNDWSFLGGMTTNSPNQNVPVYMAGVKIYGNEPPAGSSSSISSAASSSTSSAASSSSRSSSISSSAIFSSSRSSAVSSVSSAVSSSSRSSVSSAVSSSRSSAVSSSSRSSTVSSAVSSSRSSAASSAVSSSRSSVVSSVASSSRSSAVSSVASSVSGGYAVNYNISNDWGTGATVTVTMKNNSASALSSWTLVWTFAGTQVITQIWSATQTTSGATVTAKNLSYNGTIGANGGTQSFGFNMTYSGANAKPTAFTLNGTACTIY